MLRKTAGAIALFCALGTTAAAVGDVPAGLVQTIDAIAVHMEETLAYEPEEVTIPVPPEPEKPAEPTFGTVLGTSTTKYKTSQANRSNNIRLAAQAISGVVLQPGEEFSFNRVVGQRTTARGYKPAGAFANGETVTEVGGGICQVSSTLFHATLYANMQITSRVSHGLPVGYLPAGLDATVSWGGPEFKFKNSYDFPVKITASYDSAKGTLTVNVLGADDAIKPSVKVSVSQANGRYKTTRTVNGTVNYTTYSTYKNPKQ